MGEVIKNKKPDNFIYGIVYETNLFKNGDRYFTLCKECSKPYYLDKNQYCPDCEFPALDYHADGIEAEDIEKLAWSYMENINSKLGLVDKSKELLLNIIKGQELDLEELTNLYSQKHHVGLAHSEFDKSFGYPSESHIKRETISAFGKEFTKNTWMMGMIVSDELWKQASNGTINGFSFSGKGYKETL